MGLWSWMSGWLGSADRGSQTPIPELVVLLQEPRVIGTRYLQEAVHHTFGVWLPTDEPQATEFVTGEPPLFHVQFGGRLLMILYGHHPYFDPICTPFVSGDPGAILRGAERAGIGEEARASRGWIAVSFLGADYRPADEDPYQYVARLLGALASAEDQVVAAVWPSRAEIRSWADRMAGELEAGEYEAVFRS